MLSCRRGAAMGMSDLHTAVLCITARYLATSPSAHFVRLLLDDFKMRVAPISLRLTSPLMHVQVGGGANITSLCSWHSHGGDDMA